MAAQARSAQRPQFFAAKSPRKQRAGIIPDAFERLLAEVPMSELDVESLAVEIGIMHPHSYAYYTFQNNGIRPRPHRLWRAGFR